MLAAGASMWMKPRRFGVWVNLRPPVLANCRSISWKADLTISAMVSATALLRADRAIVPSESGAGGIAGRTMARISCPGLSLARRDAKAGLILLLKSGVDAEVMCRPMMTPASRLQGDYANASIACSG
jgi:hypothetical protein